MKEGLVYISKRTNQIRYASGTSGEDTTGIVSNNPDEQWLQQISIYYAKEPIKRGDPVSVTALSNENSGLGEDPYSYIVKTDSSIHTKCIGIALEYAEAGEAVHVQPFGKVIYDDSKNSNIEHKFSDDIEGDYSTLVGKVVYIGQDPGTFTIDFDQAYANGKNIIQIGVITDAPATNSQHEYAIELQPEADGRGPLDSTQFEFIIGENVVFEPDQIKVFSIAGPQNTQAFLAKIAGTPSEGFVLFEPVDGTISTVYSNNLGSDADDIRLKRLNRNYTLTPFKSSFTGAAKDYTIYISSKAKNFVSVSVLNRPQPAETGTVVLAHAGSSSRSQVIGVYKNGSKSKTFEAGDNIKLIKQGLIKGTNLEKGKKYYLTDQGDIETTPNILYDTLLVVGIANSNGDLIVDCHNSSNAHASIKPVGYIKKLEVGQAPEYGYISMKGTYSKSQYEALCNFLERCGGNEFTLNGDSFTLNKENFQIKYVDEGYIDTSIPRVPYLKLNGTFDNNIDSKKTLSLNPKVSECSLAVDSQGYDISSLAYWSPMGINSAGTEVNLSSFDIHLSVTLDDKNVEIYPGFHQYESNIYGFNWKLLAVDNTVNGSVSTQYILTIDTGDEGNFGIAYIADPKTAPTLLNGKQYEIYVSRRDNGYTSLDIVNSVLQLTRQDFDANNTLPVSGYALRNFGFTSELKAKKVLGASRSIEPTDYGNLSGNFDTTNNGYNNLLQDDTIASKALYEINSIIYKYQNDHGDAKPFIGVLIDQLRKIVVNDIFDADHSHLLINGASDLKQYGLTNKQKADIKKILNLLTNNKESAQIASSSIGLLIKAAGETQKRLLNIESALFGRDYETLPDHDKQVALGSSVYPKDNVVSPLPAQIGITRVVNALSKETLGSANPTGEAANPDNSSNNNRIKDLYKQIEGTNGDYGETGIELNLLKNVDDSFINDDNNGTGSVGESHNEISKGTLNTYPSVEYGNYGTQLTKPEMFDYNDANPIKPSEAQSKYNVPLKGINDALNRIMYKLNILTSEIHGYDDILSKPVRLSNIRTRLNTVIDEAYVKKTELSPNINSNPVITTVETEASGLASDNESYDSSFDPSITEDAMSLKEMYLGDLYTKWSSSSPSVDISTSAGFKSGSNKIYRSSIINLIKATIGDPKALNQSQIDGATLTTDYFRASRNLMSHSERLYNIEMAIETIISALFNRTKDNPSLEIDDNFRNIESIIGSPDDIDGKADITRVQQEWYTNNGFKTLNKLIYGRDTPDDKSNVIQTIIRELTGTDIPITESSDFNTNVPVTFIDTFKKFLETNHYNTLDDVTADGLNNRLIAADYIFDLTANGILYNGASVLNHDDLKGRNIFYAKATDNVEVTEEHFVKSYIFRAGIVYQFYRDGDRFGLVNDHTEPTLVAGESITIHGQNSDATVTITANGDGNLDISADHVSTLVIPTTNTPLEGALYIKE